MKEAPIQLTEHEYRIVVQSLLNFRFDEDLQSMASLAEVSSLIQKIACRFELDQTAEEAKADFHMAVPSTQNYATADE